MVAEIFPVLPVVAEGKEIEPLRFDDSVGAMIFMPDDSMTPLEAALLAQFFCRMVIGSEPLAWRAFLQRNGLMRHFEPLMKGKG